MEPYSSSQICREKKVYNDFRQQPSLKQSRIKMFFGSGKAIVNKFHSRLYWSRSIYLNKFTALKHIYKPAFCGERPQHHTILNVRARAHQRRSLEKCQIRSWAEEKANYTII